MTRDELVSSREYWITKIQIELFHELEAYMKDNGVSRTQLAEKLGVTKGYISQILNGDFDHRISKLVDLALLMGKVPHIEYSDLQTFIRDDNSTDYKSQYAFKAIIRGNPTQRYSYRSDEEDKSRDADLLTA